MSFITLVYVTVSPTGTASRGMKKMVLVPEIFVEEDLDLPTPWAQRPNSLAKEVIHVSLSGPLVSLSIFCLAPVTG